jgi:hypothetical protein
MRKGTQLEYMVYRSDEKKAKLLRLLFEVANVTDSAGSTYSTIIKKGFGIKDEQKDHYERTIQLQCDGKNLQLPFDFIGTDTLYFNDAFPSLIKRNIYYSAATPLEDANYVIPLMLEGVTSLPEGIRPVVQHIKMTSLKPQPGSDRVKGESGLWENDFKAIYKIKEIKVAGKETITTAAGAFECYILRADCDCSYEDFPMPTRYTIYYNSEMGIVKMETSVQVGRNKREQNGYLELQSVKK